VDLGGGAGARRFDCNRRRLNITWERVKKPTRYMSKISSAEEFGPFLALFELSRLPVPVMSWDRAELKLARSFPPVKTWGFPCVHK